MASAVARTSAAFASAARCRDSRTSSCRSWMRRRARRSRRRSSASGAAFCAACARITNTTVNKEPKWRHPRAELTTGYEPDITAGINSLANEYRTENRLCHEASPHPQRATSAPQGNIVEMTWDPITRIVGSLGIYTKIDFDIEEGGRVLQHVVDLPRLQHFHEEQGSARRAFHHQPHLRNLRRQPRDLLGLRAEHGVRHQAAAARRDGSSISAKPPSTCSITTFSRTIWSASISARRW